MNYSEFVRSKFKPGEKIAAEMTPHKAALLDVETYIFVNHSESLDLAKKYAIYNKRNDSSRYVMSPQRLEKFANFTPTPQQAELLHAAIGLAGEAGELLDAVRKHVFDGQPLDRDNVVEEMGDLCFYLQAAMQVVNAFRYEIEQENQAKLSKRYEAGYSDKAAQERADKAGAE